MSAAELLEDLIDLQAERACAALNGLADLTDYLEDLGEEIRQVRDAYVFAAVTEIASLRGELGARAQG